MLEYSYSGYYPFPSRLKFSSNFPGKGTLLKIVWKLSKKHPVIFEKIYKKLYYPIEFNIVFKKVSTES
jgi:hypothetical protein